MVPKQMRMKKESTISIGGLRLYLPNELLILAISTNTITKK